MSCQSVLSSLSLPHTMLHHQFSNSFASRRSTCSKIVAAAPQKQQHASLTMTKRVTFPESRNQIVTIPSICGTEQEDLWYSRKELEECRDIVKMANMAVNDACGDLDVVDHVALCRNAVLLKQQASIVKDQGQLAKISKVYSETSLELARLHALVLEKDAAVDQNGPVTHQVLFEIVNRVMIQGEREDYEEDDIQLPSLSLMKPDVFDIAGSVQGDDGDDESMGTIDELPLDQWEEANMSMDDCIVFEQERPVNNVSALNATLSDTTTFRRHQQLNYQRKSRSFSMDDSKTRRHCRRISAPPSLITLGALVSSSKSKDDSCSESPSSKTSPLTTKGVISNSDIKELFSKTNQIIGDLPRPLSPRSTTSTKEFFVSTVRCSLVPTLEQEKTPFLPSPPKEESATESIIKRALQDAEHDLSSLTIMENDEEPKTKRQRTADPLVPEDVESRCHVAHALISLSRWEFRSGNLPLFF